MPITKPIDIPVPCSAQWDKMAPNNNGRFCGECHKIVIDFTSLTNQQIINIISESPRVCGKFETRQLARINDVLSRETTIMAPNTWKRIAIAAAVIWSIPQLKAEAQSQPATVQLRVVKDNSEPMRTTSDTATYRTITGKLLIAQSGLPLIGAAIVGTNVGKTYITTFSNQTGDFKIKVPSTAKDIKISCVGYIPKTVELNEKLEYLISVDEAPSFLMGEVVAPSITNKTDKKNDKR